MEPSLRPLQAAYQQALAPPERLSWVEFAEKHMRLTSRETATPGPLHLWATQRGIIDVINAGEHQFITVMKAARAGIPKAAIIVPAVCIAATKAANILILVPREALRQMKPLPSAPCSGRLNARGGADTVEVNSSRSRSSQAKRVELTYAQQT